MTTSGRFRRRIFSPKSLPASIRNASLPNVIHHDRLTVSSRGAEIINDRPSAALTERKCSSTPAQRATACRQSESDSQRFSISRTRKLEICIATDGNRCVRCWQGWGIRAWRKRCTYHIQLTSRGTRPSTAGVSRQRRQAAACLATAKDALHDHQWVAKLDVTRSPALNPSVCIKITCLPVSPGVERRGGWGRSEPPPCNVRRLRRCAQAVRGHLRV